jgi:DNA-binding MarR family transcriptional regulator
LIQRELDPSDLRRHRLALTDKGRETLSRAGAVLATCYDQRLTRLTAAQRATFAALLDKLTR